MDVSVCLTVCHFLTSHKSHATSQQCTVFMGCSSFLESNSGYPEKYMNDGELVGKTKVASRLLNAY